MLVRMWRKGNLVHGWWESGVVTVRNSMEGQNAAINTVCDPVILLMGIYLRNKCTN